ncbi:hypothetical protein KIL84_015588, partial [Mauremys mutica]
MCPVEKHQNQELGTNPFVTELPLNCFTWRVFGKMGGGDAFCPRVYELLDEVSSLLTDFFSSLVSHGDDFRAGQFDPWQSTPSPLVRRANGQGFSYKRGRELNGKKWRTRRTRGGVTRNTKRALADAQISSSGEGGGWGEGDLHPIKRLSTRAGHCLSPDSGTSGTSVARPFAQKITQLRPSYDSSDSPLVWTRCRPERASSGREAQGKALNSLGAEPKLTKCPGDEKRRRAWDCLREEEKAQDVIHYRGNALPRECFAKSGSQLSGLDQSVVSDASGCSMIALFHTGAAKISPTLLPRVRQALCSHRLRCFLQGCGSTLNRKLASHGFGASMAAMSSFPPQRYHYFLVLDFEATCDKPQIHPQEIIEFPILKLNGRTMEIESTFHMYVQPVVHPQLTPFCTELTGIIQGMVDGQPNLQQVLERVDEWMAKEGLLDPSVKSIFVTCGDWDLKVMLPGQCQYLGLPVADYFKQWINLKK